MAHGTTKRKPRPGCESGLRIVHPKEVAVLTSTFCASGIADLNIKRITGYLLPEDAGGGQAAQPIFGATLQQPADSSRWVIVFKDAQVDDKRSYTLYVVEGDNQ